MPLVDTAVSTAATPTDHAQSTITLVVATACLIWYVAVAIVCTVGLTQLYEYSVSANQSTADFQTDGDTIRDRRSLPQASRVLWPT